MNREYLNVERPEAVADGERRVLELIATGAPLETSLDALCRFIDGASGQRSSILLLDAAGDRLTLAAGPSLPQSWRLAAASFSITQTVCGAAIAARRQIVYADIAADHPDAGYRAAAAQAGIRAVWSTPFHSKDGRPLGTFALYAGAIGTPSDEQLALVRRATHIASIAVDRQQTEARLRESERRFAAAFYASPCSLSILRRSDGQFMYVNDQFVAMFGHSRDEAIGRTGLELGLWDDPAQREELWRRLEQRQANGFEARMRTKSGGTVDVLMWMEPMDVLGEERVLTVSCDITDRARAGKVVARSERLLKTVLDALPVGVAVVDSAGNVILNNPASQRIWGHVIQSGTERYARSRAWWHHSGQEVAPHEWASVRACLYGETSVNEVVDIEGFDGVRKVIQSSAVPIRDGDDCITGAVIVIEDVSAHTRTEHERIDALENLRGLTARLMHAQDDERRRIAQMLHETTAQDLAGLKMLLARLRRTSAGLLDSDRALVDESVELADRAITQVRTLSYLLHPPFLDEAGLLSALRWYARGFADRSDIVVDLDLPAALTRLPNDVETTLFRVVQEALINIHRHAESQTARIGLRVGHGRLTLDVRDGGKGMDPMLLARLREGISAPGVGIAGMRERLKQIGGSLDIESGPSGTTVRASVPLGAETA